MTPQDDRALLIAMILFLLSAMLLIATTRINHADGNRAEIMAPVTSPTTRHHQ